MVTSKYNLKEFKKKTIIECINDNPLYKREEWARLLGISSRNLYRKLIDYNIKLRKDSAIAKILNNHKIPESKL